MPTMTMMMMTGCRWSRRLVAFAAIATVFWAAPGLAGSNQAAPAGAASQGGINPGEMRAAVVGSLGKNQD